MTRKTFDLILLEVVGLGMALTGARLWATRELIAGSGGGWRWETAKALKAVTA